MVPLAQEESSWRITGGSLVRCPQGTLEPCELTAHRRLCYIFRMPACKHCGVHFPSRLVIKNKLQAHKRKYCLECLPVGKNKRPLHVRNSTVDRGDTVVCGCGRVYIYEKSRGHAKTNCNSCAVNSRRFSVKKRAVEYKGGNCERCGYSRCLSALQFHHIDPSKKDFSPGGNHSVAWSRMQLELDKCALLCSNCHIEVHAEISAKANRKARNYQEGTQRQKEASPVFVPNTCPGCGKRLARHNKTCQGCRPAVYKIAWPDISVIKALVTKTSFEEAARQLKVSSNAIRKHLEKLK